MPLNRKIFVLFLYFLTVLLFRIPSFGVGKQNHQNANETFIKMLNLVSPLSFLDQSSYVNTNSNYYLSNCLNWNSKYHIILCCTRDTEGNSCLISSFSTPRATSLLYMEWCLIFSHIASWEVPILQIRQLSYRYYINEERSQNSLVAYPRSKFRSDFQFMQ